MSSFTLKLLYVLLLLAIGLSFLAALSLGATLYFLMVVPNEDWSFWFCLFCIFTALYLVVRLEFRRVLREIKQQLQLDQHWFLA